MTQPDTPDVQPRTPETRSLSGSMTEPRFGTEGRRALTLMLGLLLTQGAAVCTLIAPPPVAAQYAVDELTPRAIADSSYGVRLELERLAEAIRWGEDDSGAYSDGDLAAAVTALLSAALRRGRMPPAAGLGILWDFRIEVADVRAVGPGALEVTALVLLSTDEGSAGAATLVFRRFGSGWRLADHQGLTARLREITRRLVGGAAP